MKYKANAFKDLSKTVSAMNNNTTLDINNFTFN